MSSIMEIGLFGNDDGLYQGKFFGDDGLIIEGEFVDNKGDYQLTFSGNTGTKIKTKSGMAFFKGPSKFMCVDSKNISEKTGYAGIIKKGGLNGKGVYNYINNDVKINEEGNFKDGKLDGAGKRTKIYVGIGKSVEEGNFTNGKLNGFGKTISTSGPDYRDSYVGELKDGTPEGKGILKEIDKSGFNRSRKFEGNFINGKLNGFGKITDLDDGFIYTGYIKDGYPEGKGKIDYPDGDSVKGLFEGGVLINEEGLFKHNSNVPMGWPKEELKTYATY